VTPAELRAAQAEAGRILRQADQRPARESVEGKAARLLAAGRVHVLAVSPGHSLVEVVGDSGTWRLAYRRGRWVCPCPAPAWRRCSHLAAVELIVGRPGNAKEINA
jgi:hypothetical protein